MAKQILTERFDTKLEEVLTEASASLPKGVIMRFRGKFGHAGRITENGRLYPRKVMQRELERIKPKLADKAVIGETDHPDPTRGSSSVRQSAFIITGLLMNEQGEIHGEADVVDTAAGRDLANLIRAGAQVGVSSRGRGTHHAARMTSSHPEFEQNQSWKDKDFDEVNDDFSLRTYDAVIGQAVEDAYVGDYREQQSTQEGKEMDLEQLKKLLGENAELRKQLIAHVFESDDGKAKVKETVDKAVQEATDKMQKSIKSMVNSYLLSDEFGEQFGDVVPDAGGDGHDHDDTNEGGGVQCSKCNAFNKAGATKCSKCGGKLSGGEEEEESALVDLRKALAAQEQSNKDLKKRIEEMENGQKAKEEQAQVRKTVEEMLAGKPNLLAEAVREDVDLTTLTPETVKEVVEKKLARLTSFAKVTGGQLTEATGQGRSVPNDANNTTPPAKTRDEAILDSLR